MGPVGARAPRKAMEGPARAVGEDCLDRVRSWGCSCSNTQLPVDIRSGFGFISRPKPSPSLSFHGLAVGEVVQHGVRFDSSATARTIAPLGERARRSRGRKLDQLYIESPVDYGACPRLPLSGQSFPGVPGFSCHWRLRVRRTRPPTLGGQRGERCKHPGVACAISLLCVSAAHSERRLVGWVLWCGVPASLAHRDRGR